MKNLNPKRLLIILLSIWGLLLFYRIATYEKPRTAPLKYVKGQAVIRQEEITERGEDKKGESRLRKDLLYKKLEASLQISRNIFAPLYTPPPPVKKPSTPTTPPKPEIKVPTPEEIAMERSKAELNKFKYLGFMNKGGINEAFLSKENELISAKKGETIKGKYLLKDISPNTVLIQDKETLIEQSVSISE